MSVLPIKQAGEPVLKAPNALVPVAQIQEPAIQHIITEMFETMAATKGVGLAAPQVGINKQILVYGFEQNPRYPQEKPVPPTVLINPVILNQSQETVVGFEGCLSLGTLRGEVPRSRDIEVEAYNEKGKKFIKKATGFEARIIQHEIDHLNGMLNIERIQNYDRFGFTEILRANKIVE